MLFAHIVPCLASVLFFVTEKMANAEWGIMFCDDLFMKSGIYRIRNIINEKFYIGSSLIL